MSQLQYFLAFGFLGAIITLVATSLRVVDIKDVWKLSAIAFLKLALGSAFAIFMVWALYIYTVLTYPVLFVLFTWLFLGDRLFPPKKAES